MPYIAISWHVCWEVTSICYIIHLFSCFYFTVKLFATQQLWWEFIWGYNFPRNCFPCSSNSLMWFWKCSLKRHWLLKHILSHTYTSFHWSSIIVTVELPVKFVKKLRDKIAMYKHRGHLECQVSRANAKVKWYKNKTEIKPGDKYEIRSEDVYRKLTINDVDEGDEDTYTCDALDDKTSCKLLVEGNTMGDDNGCLYLASGISVVSHLCIWL